MKYNRVFTLITLAAIATTSCSRIFHRDSNEDAPTFNVTDIDSSREYTPHPDVKINEKEDKEATKPVVEEPKIDIVADSIALADSLKSLEPKYIPFTEEQSSKMVIAEYINAEFDDCTIDLRQSNSHYPTDGLHVTSPYGWRHRRMHAGIDLKVNKGDNIYAAFDGVVRLAKYYGAYGYCLILRHDNGLETLYGHSSKLLVDVNDRVKAGDVIALGGSTGRSTGAHCHFETRIKGIYFDPNLVIDTKSTKIKDANLYIAKRGNRLFASNNDDKESREAYILEQITIKYYIVRSGDVLSRIAARNNTTVTKLCQINGISSRSTLRIGQRLIVREGIKPQKKSSATTTAAPAKSTTTTTAAKSTTSAPAGNISYHSVRSGDTLSEIATRYGTTVSKICALNGITSRTTLQIGQKIKVVGTAAATSAPSSSTSIHTVRSGDTLSGIAAKYDTTVSKLCAMNGISSRSTLNLGQKIKVSGSATTSTTSSSSASYHTVRSGDTLSGIAAKHGTTVSKLCALNGISSRSTLNLGQKIRLR